MATQKTQEYVITRKGVDDKSIGDIVKLTEDQALGLVNKVRLKRDHESEAKSGIKLREVQKELKAAIDERDEALFLVEELREQSKAITEDRDKALALVARLQAQIKKPAK